MYLTKQEERMLDGEHGWASQVCMKILVRLGDLFGATKLVPIDSAHISGVSYKHLGDAAIDFLEALARQGGRARTVATLNPSSFDPRYLQKRYKKERVHQQKRVIELFRKMRVQPTLTCTPYYFQEPKIGEHLAWSESSAVVYANSVLKAWTNREGGPSALAAALIGKTPNYGMHQPENRQPNVIVRVEAPLRNETDFGSLGILLGKQLGDRIPAFERLQGADDDLKQLSAALASSGMTALFHAALDKTDRREKFETVSVEPKDLKKTADDLCTATQQPDLVFFGCPHCSAGELQKIADAIDGKKVKKNTELWVCTSRYIREKAIEQVAVIEKAGGHVLRDTCILTTWVKDLGVKTLMTNSAKTAFYAPTLNEVAVALAPMKQCIKTACKN